jgi:heme exporter protein B
MWLPTEELAPRGYRVRVSRWGEGVKRFARKVAAIVWKDLVAELRTKEIFTSMFVFALLVVVIFNFAFELRRVELEAIGPGVLWVAFTFAGVLGLNRAFVLEKDRGCLEGLMLCPVDRSAIYVGKLVGILIFMTIMEAIALPIFAVLSNLPLFFPGLIPIIFLGTLGFATVGTLFSAMAVNTRTREVMLPVLLFPIVVPVIIAAVKATGQVLGGQPLSATADWLNLMVAFDVIFFIVAVLAFEYVVEE